MFSWRKNREVSYEEFKLLTNEWNKTCKLLTSGNFYLAISHSQEIFHERWFFSILKDAYPDNQDRSAEVEHIVESRKDFYLEKLKETPFLGYDFEQKPIYSLNDDQLALITKVYEYMDTEGKIK